MSEVAEVQLPADDPVGVAAKAEKSETNTAAEEAATTDIKEMPMEEVSSSGKDKDSEVVSADKMDELISLEQEIAKMHNIEPDTAESEQAESAASQECVTSIAASRSSSAAENGTNEKKTPDELAQTRSTPVDQDNIKVEVPSPALEEVDLIALLKGTDTSEQQEPAVELSLDELNNVGVTIEGEGQYEIMEIEDDDNGLEGHAPPPGGARKGAAAKSPVKVHNKLYGKAKLSPEQARAVALEQMADLKSQLARRKEIVSAKPHAQDIISTLNDDWNEYDSGSDIASNAPTSQAIKKAPTKTTNLDIKPVVSNIMLVKAVPVLKPAAKAVPIEAPVTESTGFKRTRVIKRKIIWDPDVPETQKSYSQYANTKPASTAAPAATASAKTASSPTIAVTVVKKEPAPKKSRNAATPKERPSAVSVLTESIKAPTKRANTPSRAAALADAPSPPKRRSQTPSVAAALPNGAGFGKKKKVTEIDRLMGDEGAANMIQAVEHEQRELSGGSETRETINKPVMRTRALTITGRPPRAVEVPATTPKKEPAVSSPKTTKRATSSSSSTAAAAVDAVFAKAASAKPKPRASDSWDYVYKQRASEESMIMRRRSNSSYSSNASVSRLSLDNKTNTILPDDAVETTDPSFKFLKPENKANQRSSTDGGGADSVAHTLANDLKKGAQPKEAKAVAKTELVAIHKLEKVAQLVINTQRAKTSHTFNTQLLHKLTDMLNKVAKSNEYNTVLLSVQGEEFCQGIDCQELIVGALEKRKNSASQFASALKTYLETLATFPKPLVAGIMGDVKNLGVMQLPLLDYVVAANDCSFETNYAKIGQLPEGYALWHNHYKVSSSVHARLFLLGERLHSSDLVAPTSFIDSVSNACSVNEDALAVAKRISATTAENYRTLKKLNHTVANEEALNRLEEEFKIITEQWATANCQANFKRFLNDVDF